MALFPIVLSLAAWIFAYRTPGLGRWVRWLAAFTFLGTIAQAPLGLLTIRLDLHPLMVATHFLLALVVLATATVVAVEAWGNAHGRVESPVPRWLRLVGLVLAGACGILVVTGTLSTAAGPHPGDSAEIERFWNLLDAVHIHVRATAAFGLSLPAPARLALPQPRPGGVLAAGRGDPARAPARADGGRRAAVAEPAALVARADPRRARRARLGVDGRARDRALAHPAYTDVDERAAHGRRPALQRPVLVAAFRGWNDGGQGATLAAGYLARIWDAERFADIDPENFVDFQANRPHVSLDEGLTRRIEWPENAFYHARIPGTERDVVLLLGVEPSLRWQTFSQLVVDLSRDLDVELVVTLGSLLADVPHTRAAPVTGAASDPELVASLGLQHSRYEGADRDRRRAPGHVPRARASGREPLGRRAPLRLARAEPPCGPGALRPARAAARRPDRHGRARQAEESTSSR